MIDDGAKDAIGLRNQNEDNEKYTLSRLFHFLSLAKIFYSALLVHSLYNAKNQNMGCDSVMRTPVSSPNRLNSSSNYVKSGTEEERESFCSDLFEFEIPESLDFADIFCNVPYTPIN